MNSLLIFLIRHDNTTSLAAHLLAGMAALALLIGTSRADAPATGGSSATVVQSAPAKPLQPADAKRVDLPIAAVASTTPVRR